MGGMGAVGAVGAVVDGFDDVPLIDFLRTDACVEVR